MEPMKSAAEIMRDAGVPNMLEGRELRLQPTDIYYQRAMERSAEIRAKLDAERNPMRKIISYASGTIALLIVAASVVAATVYVVQNGMATLSNLATSTLSGIGMAIGSCLGAALVLRFKAARRFIGNTLKDIRK